MSYESPKDPATDPELRLALERARQADPNQMSLFSESARPEPEETEDEIQKSLRATLRRYRGPKQA